MHVSLGKILKEISQSFQSLNRIKQLHASILRIHLLHQPFFATRLVRFYAMHGDLLSAHHLFDQTPDRSVYLWNSIIRAYARIHDLEHVRNLFAEMRNSETKPDNFTYACILLMFMEVSDLCGVKMFHCSVIVSGLASDSVIGSTVVRAYSKLGHINDARDTFDEIPEPDLVLWNSLISGYGCAGLWVENLDLFSRKRNCGKKPDGFTLVGLISSFRDPSLLKLCQGIHGYCLKDGLDLNVHVGSALVSMYSRVGSFDSAYLIFNSLQQPDLVTWSALIKGASLSKECNEALVIFRKFIKIGMTPDPVLISSILPVCAKMVMSQLGKEIHCYVLRHGFETSFAVSSAVLDVYTKCGFPEMGLRVFEMMAETNVVAYNTLIAGLGSNGFGRKAIQLFEEILGEDLEPDPSTFSAVLSSCCHGGFVEEGIKYFRSMEREHGLKPRMEDYIYMVKLLGGAGKLEDAYGLIMNMPMTADSSVWGAFLSSCLIHGDCEMGKNAANELIKIEPEKASHRVMLSNIYAASGRWEDAKNLRDGMVSQRIQKTAGISRIQDCIFLDEPSVS